MLVDGKLSPRHQVPGPLDGGGGNGVRSFVKMPPDCLCLYLPVLPVDNLQSFLEVLKERKALEAPLPSHIAHYAQIISDDPSRAEQWGRDGGEEPEGRLAPERFSNLSRGQPGHGNRDRSDAPSLSPEAVMDPERGSGTARPAPLPFPRAAVKGGLIWPLCGLRVRGGILINNDLAP